MFKICLNRNPKKVQMIKIGLKGPLYNVRIAFTKKKKKTDFE
jgi:hypothetical protein